MKIHSGFVYEMRPLDKLPAKEHDDHDRDFNIIGNKVDALKMRTEAFPTLYQHEDNIKTDGNDRTEGVSPVLERKQMFQTLSTNSTSETQRCNTDADP